MSGAEFRFVFADREDMFFSRLMLKLDFEQYLYLKMRREEFQYIYYFYSLDVENARICCDTYQELKKYTEKTRKGFLKKTADIPDNRTVRLHSDSGRMMYSYEQPKKKVLDNIETLFTEPCVFVFSMSSFHDIFTREDIRRLDRLLSKNRYNKQKILFVLVENENYDGQLPYLPESVLSEDDIMNINTASEDESFINRLKSRQLACQSWGYFQNHQIDRMVRRALNSRTELADDDRIGPVSDFLYKYLVEEGKHRLFEVNINSQRDLYQKILLDKEYMRMLQDRCSREQRNSDEFRYY